MAEVRHGLRDEPERGQGHRDEPEKSLPTDPKLKSYPALKLYLDEKLSK
jgi:hypothetical protein